MNKSTLILNLTVSIILSGIAWTTIIFTDILYPLPDPYFTPLTYIAPILTFTASFLLQTKLTKQPRKPAAETLQKTTPPPSPAAPEEIEEITVTPAPAPQQLPQKPQPLLGQIICECGTKFNSVVVFYRHRRETGHTGIVEEQPPEEPTPPPTQITPQESPEAKPQTVEEIENKIKLTQKQIELEKQETELERTRTVKMGLIKIRNEINEDKISVIPSKDLLTKNGPATSYITILKDKDAKAGDHVTLDQIL